MPRPVRAGWQPGAWSAAVTTRIDVTETDDPIEGGAKQGLAPRRQGKQVLRRRPAAQRPQARAAAAREHEDMEAHALTCRLRRD